MEGGKEGREEMKTKRKMTEEEDRKEGGKEGRKERAV